MLHPSVNLWEPFFKCKNAVFNGVAVQEKESIICIRMGPRGRVMTNRDHEGQIFLSHPQTHYGFLSYYTPRQFLSC